MTTGSAVTVGEVGAAERAATIAGTTSGSMTTRSELVTAATVGTAHRSIDLAALPGMLRPEPLPADPAAGLLDAAALSVLARRTIPQSPPAAAGPPAEPAPEVVEVVPPVIVQVLSRVLSQPAILLETLTLIREAGLRLPPELLPGLLDDTRAEVVSATRPVAGEIGRFLMTKNPRWAAPVEPDPTDRTIWDEGTTAERAAWLRALREVDPDTARSALAQDFSRETASNRADLLAVLADRLSPADQEFLLAAVGDRSRLVVTVALTLLIRLPDSPLRQDLRRLAARRLQVARRLLRTTVTVGELSTGDFAPWPIPGGAPWTELLSRIDPADWAKIFGSDLLKLIADGAAELAPLYPGFRLAAITFGHSGLARVLIAQALTRGNPKIPPTVDGELWAVLEPSDALAVLDLLLGHRLVRASEVTVAATALQKPWPAPLARRFARWLPTGGSAGAPAPKSLWDLWASAAALPDCRVLIDLIRAAPDQHPTGDHASALTTRVSNAANLLTLRAVLYENLCFPGGNQ